MPFDPEQPTPFQHRSDTPGAPGAPGALGAPGAPVVAGSPLAGFDATRPLGPPRDPGSPFSRLIAIVATLALVVGVVALQRLGAESRSAPTGVAVETIPQPDLQMVLTGRMAMGVRWLSVNGGQPSGANGAMLVEQMDTLAAGSVRDRVRAAILAGEMLGAEGATERLDAAAAAADAIEQEISLRAASPEADRTEAARLRDETNLKRLPLLREDIAALRALYASPSAADAALTQPQREALVERHGMFGEVALAYNLPHADPARAPILADGMRTLVTLVSAFSVAVLAFLAGLVLFVLALVRVATRGLARSYAPPAPGGSVYLETVALFLAGFVAVSVAGELLRSATGLDLTLLLLWLLLLVPLWPLLRGQPWRNHRFALGWTRGRGVAREVGAGVVGYLACLPIFAFGVVCTLVLAMIVAQVRAMLGSDSEGAPMSHPIMDQLVGGSVLTLVVLLLLAAVWAPLAEESVFRGAFYHHLRGARGVLLSALLTGFVFAIIHPQGFVAVPALMSLGVSFAILREWRGSLIAPVTAHALHNGFLVTMMWLALG